MQSRQSQTYEFYSTVKPSVCFYYTLRGRKSILQMKLNLFHELSQTFLILHLQPLDDFMPNLLKLA